MATPQALRAGFDCEESPKTKAVEESPQNCCIVPEMRKEFIPMDYKFIADLLADVNVPTEGILSRVLQKDEHVNITLFGFSPGQELSTHSAPTPAVLYFLNGEADVTLGDDVHQAKNRIICVHASSAASRHCCEVSDDDAAGADQTAEAGSCLDNLRWAVRGGWPNLNL
jgi:hypothetical protein